jgi:hypothetical protein
MKRIILTLILMSIILLSDIKPSKSDCCGVHIVCQKGSHKTYYCYDCTYPTPFCGKTRCNIFGCNCICRKKNPKLWCYKSDSGCYETPDYYEELNAKYVFDSIDVDSDGKISLTEAKIYIQQNKPEIINIDEEFAKFDINNDGFLSPKEFDDYKTTLD